MEDKKGTTGFMSIREAREQLGISKVTMIQLVRGSGVTLYDDPLDKRKKLIKRDDLGKIAQPRPRKQPVASTVADSNPTQDS